MLLATRAPKCLGKSFGFTCIHAHYEKPIPQLSMSGENVVFQQQHFNTLAPEVFFCFFFGCVCSVAVSPFQVYQAAWWMGHYGHMSPKRHICWSNSPRAQCLDMGRMARDFQKLISSEGCKPARTYINSAGKKAFHGTKWLKGTQTLVEPCGFQTLSRLFKGLLASVQRSHDAVKDPKSPDYFGSGRIRRGSGCDLQLYMRSFARPGWRASSPRLTQRRMPTRSLRQLSGVTCGMMRTFRLFCTI